MENDDTKLENFDFLKLLHRVILESLTEERSWQENPHLASRVADCTVEEVISNLIEANKWNCEVAPRLTAACRELEAARQALISIQEYTLIIKDKDINVLLTCIKIIEKMAARYSRKSRPDLILKRRGRPRQSNFGYYIELLAWSYLGDYGKWPTATYDPVSGEYRGHFIEWALEKLLEVEPKQSRFWPKDGQTRARAIARLLREKRPKDLDQLIRQ